MFIAAKICGLGALPYTLWACLLREIHNSSTLNKADRQVVTDRHAEMDSVMRTTEQTSMVQPACFTITNDLMPHRLYIFNDGICCSLIEP